MDYKAFLSRIGITDSAIEKFAPANKVGVSTKEGRIYLDGPIVSSLDRKLFEGWLGDLGLVSPDSFKDAMAEIKGDVELYINSPGGSVFDASMIQAEILDRQKNDNVSVVVGGIAASAASFLAMTGTTLAMAPMAMIMVHEASAIAYGRASDMRGAADILDKINASLASQLEEASNISAEDAAKFIEAETWWTAKEAVELGIADTILSGDNSPGETKPAARNVSRIAAQLAMTGGVL